MSIHLVECAARMDLPASTKLALMAFADSADARTGIGIPGMDQVRVWSGLSKSQASDVVSDLVTLGLLKHHRRGHRGRRAEYVVFPNGCCAAHPAVEEATDSAGAIETIAPAGPDSSRTHAPALPGAIPETQSIAPGPPDPMPGKHPESTRSGPDPFLTTSTNPPSPPTDVGGSPSTCPTHPDAPGRNSRRCGTTRRQATKQETAAAAERARLRALDETRRRRDELAAAKTAARARPPGARRLDQALAKAVGQ